MRQLIIFSILAISFNTSAQSVQLLQKEIDSTIWKPFQKAFETLDGEALNATYAEDVLRVTPEGIDTENSFKVKNLERFVQNKKEGISITLDFWFDSRRTNETTSYEVGFYRIGFKNSKNETTFSYGQFHIVLEKLDGQWKITQDWDTNIIKGKSIGEADFSIKRPLRF
ncbi:hypothetical protein [Croceitalea rosinachiae]|uniref:DUF4440 domain-containing protein n=1 Tax=Croceitalea rosinachiae TaxID=3075596 RepID=A0ABU3A751_9FLAO|nr:hypothetical protein [Croceitalea sp. F388]MDT0605996.1 hypothetical protein [Croceitalea sp. F388]